MDQKGVKMNFLGIKQVLDLILYKIGWPSIAAAVLPGSPMVSCPASCIRRCHEHCCCGRAAEARGGTRPCRCCTGHS
jgi:hypothetical protein